MNMKQVWAASGGFFLVYILITLTNKPHPGQSDDGRARRHQRPGVERAANDPDPGVGNGARTAGAAEAGGPVALSSAFQRGVVFICPGATALAEPTSDQALGNIAGAGANWVAIDLRLAQEAGSSLHVEADAALTPTVTTVAHAIDEAHRQKLHVMLRPVVVARDGTNREDFAPADPRRWLASYGNALAPYLAMAGQHQVELVSIGSGYSRIEGSAPWGDLVRQARQGYTGSLTYGASHTAYQTVPFWSQLDYIGIDGFFPLTSDASAGPSAFTAGWQRVAREVGDWVRGNAGGKQVLFTAVGLPALAGAGQQPGHPDPTASSDPAAQVADCQAFFQTMASQAWLAGAFWYAWEARQAASRPNPYGVQDGPALAALQAVYGAASGTR